MDLSRQSSRLPSEHKNCPLAVVDIPEGPLRLRAEKNRIPEGRQLRFEVGPTAPYPRFDMLPIVEPGALDLTLVEREPQRLDQMKLRSRREARPPGVAGIPVNLGMDQDYVE